MKKILFTGGGSAGHVVPNLALIDELKDKCELFYIGTDAIEKRLVPPLKIPFYEVSCPKLIRGKILENISLPARLIKAKKQCGEILEKIKPDLVFSKGGYVSVPVVDAAKRLRIPCLTHESDFSVGLANRFNAGKCEEILTSFPETADAFKNGKYTGSPVRKQLFFGDRQKAREKYGFSMNKPVLLVFGGGSGSKTINEALRNILPMLSRKYSVLHICGKGNVMQNNIAGYIQREYENDMASAYAAADLVIARAGANTIFEILALKKKSLLIPLENSATRGDQLTNAQYFADKRLCNLLREKDLGELFTAIEKTTADKEMEGNLKINAETNGTKNIVNEINNLLYF